MPEKTGDIARLLGIMAALRGTAADGRAQIVGRGGRSLEEGFHGSFATLCVMILRKE